MIKIIILILYQTLLTHTRCDHVAIISCAENPSCLANVDWETMKVIKENIYNTTNPCEDFWDYTCGSWTAQPYYDHEDTFGALTNNYAKQILNVLQKLQPSGNANAKESTTMVQKMWQYYESCHSAGVYYLDVSKYFKELPFDQIFGNNFQWDLMFYKNSTFWITYNWLQTSSALRKYGFNGVFLEESMGFASNDSFAHVVEMKIPRAERKFENKFQILEILEEYQLTSEQNSQYIWQLVEEIYEFDKQMTKLYKKYELSANYSRIMNLEELVSTNSAVDWQFYFATLASEQSLKNSQVSWEIYGHLDYFHDLHMILSEKHNSIVAWYFVLNFCKYLDSIKPLITDRDCILHTGVMFPLAINYIYNRFLYKTRKEDELILGDILQKLKQHFLIYLEDNKFDLHDAELQYLRDKLSAVQLQIGNLPNKLPPLDDYYSSAQLLDNNFFANHLEMLKFRFHQQHLSLWMESNFSLNLQSYYVNDDISILRNAPYFSHRRNLLIVPELFLQLPFYHHRQHSLFQYSLVGWIMAHELSHSFDSFGLQFDSLGNRNPVGLQISLKPSFSAVMKCLSCQSPTSTALNERLADVNGFQLVWDVYSQNCLDQVNNLPSNFSVQQLFFLNFAQFFCGSLPQVVAHDRDDVRVRVAVRNLREFSQIFQCTKGDAECPCQTCNVWRK